MQEEKERKLRETAKVLEEREMREVTFHPNTEPHKGVRSASRLHQRNGELNKSLRGSPKGVRREEMLIDYGRML